MTEIAALAEFLLARVEEEELLGRAFGDADVLLECAVKRRVVTAGGSFGRCVLGLAYIDHPDYRFQWMT